MPDLLLNSIRPDPDQPRKRLAPDAIADFAASLWRTGLVTPISVTENAEPLDAILYTVLAGEMRLQAFLLNRKKAIAFFDLATSPKPEDQAFAERYGRWTTIPAVVQPAPPPAERLVLQLVENERRHSLTLSEAALGWARAFQESGLSQRAFAERFGLGRHYLSAYIQIAASTSDHLKAALENAVIGDALVVASFVKLPPDLQEALVVRAPRDRQPVSREVVQRELEQLERARTAKERAAAAPPPTPQKQDDVPLEVHSEPAEQPSISLQAVEWLLGHLASESTPEAVEIRESLQEALDHSHPLILLQERGFVPAGAGTPSQAVHHV
jgi:ParB family chromosome partitioning protein